MCLSKLIFKSVLAALVRSQLTSYPSSTAAEFVRPVRIPNSVSQAARCNPIRMISLHRFIQLTPMESYPCKNTRGVGGRVLLLVTRRSELCRQSGSPVWMPGQPRARAEAPNRAPQVLCTHAITNASFFMSRIFIYLQTLGGVPAIICNTAETHPKLSVINAGNSDCGPDSRARTGDGKRRPRAASVVDTAKFI